MKRTRFTLGVRLVLASTLLIGLSVTAFGLIFGLGQGRTYRDVAGRERRRGIADVRAAGVTLASRIANAVAPAIAENNFGLAKEVIDTTARVWLPTFGRYFGASDPNRSTMVRWTSFA